MRHKSQLKLLYHKLIIVFSRVDISMSLSVTHKKRTLKLLFLWVTSLMRLMRRK